jgi:hypothetical protein
MSVAFPVCRPAAQHCSEPATAAGGLHFSIPGSHSGASQPGGRVDSQRGNLEVLFDIDREMMLTRLQTFSLSEVATLTPGASVPPGC